MLDYVGICQGSSLHLFYPFQTACSAARSLPAAKVGLPSGDVPFSSDPGLLNGCCKLGNPTVSELLNIVFGSPTCLVVNGNCALAMNWVHGRSELKILEQFFKTESTQHFQHIPSISHPACRFLCIYVFLWHSHLGRVKSPRTSMDWMPEKTAIQIKWTEPSMELRARVHK